MSRSICWISGIFLKSRTTRKANQFRAILEFDKVEDRIVLSHMGFGGIGDGGWRHSAPPVQPGAKSSGNEYPNLLQSLNSIGIVMLGGRLGGGDLHGEPATGAPSGGTATPSPGDTLQLAIDKLRTDSLALAAKSSVTIADLSALMSDSKTILSTGAKVDPTAIGSAVTLLAKDITGSTSTDDAKAAFNTIFSGTSVSQATIDQTFSDLSQVITHSNVTTADLDLIATDKAAIDAARQAIGSSGQTPEPGVSSQPGATGSTASGTPATSGNGSGQTTPVATTGSVNLLGKPRPGHGKGRPGHGTRH